MAISGEKGRRSITCTFLPPELCGCFWSSVQTRGLSCQRSAKWFCVISRGWFWEFSPHIYVCNQWRFVLTAHTSSPEIYACLNRARHSSSPMEWSAWAILTISCVTFAVSPLLKLTWSKYSSNKPWEYRMSFNSHNGEHPLGRTLRVVAAELFGLTERIAILRYLLAEWCGICYLTYVAIRVTLAEESVVRPVIRAREILDSCRQREIYSLNALQMKVTLIAVDAGHCCARIPDSSIKFYVHMLFWNLKIQPQTFVLGAAELSASWLSHIPTEKSPVPTGQEAGWPPKMFWRMGLHFRIQFPILFNCWNL